MCKEKDHYLQFIAERATLPPLTSGATLHWHSEAAESQSVELTRDAEPGSYAGLPIHGQQIDWHMEAATLTFYLEPKLLLASMHSGLSGVTGTLLWVQRQGEESIPAAVHPALLVQTASASRQQAYVELVPHMPLDDPLYHHILSVLQATVTAEGLAARLYAEALANALADHLLRRYAACQQSERLYCGGLTPSKLQRTIAYIQTHLEHELSLRELAAVTQTSPAHFARLFKQATGQTPHHYVILCRIERAKHLLTETTLPLHEIGAQVGYADQSHFTALFRQHVSTTAKAYRAAMLWGIGAPPARFAHDSHRARRNVTDGADRMPYLPSTCVMEPPRREVLVPS